MLGIVPPDPLGVSPPFPMSKLTRSRPLLDGTANAGGGLVDVPRQNGNIAARKQRKFTVVTPIFSTDILSWKGGAKLLCCVGRNFEMNDTGLLDPTK